LARGGGVAKAGAVAFEGTAMLGIAAIVLFIVVFGALNVYEFGRLD
jgi:hypothetical protein